MSGNRGTYRQINNASNFRAIKPSEMKQDLSLCEKPNEEFISRLSRKVRRKLAKNKL
jgi:hypothetical protein